MGSLGDSSGMEVFVRGVPERITENELNKFFASSMERLKIEDWVCQKIGRKAFANIVFLRPTEGRRFLNKHGNMIGPGVETLVLQGRCLTCCQSSKPIDLLAVRSLEMDRKRRMEEKESPKKPLKTDSPKHQRTFLSSAIQCGTWDCLDAGFALRPYYTSQQPAKLVFKVMHIQYETGTSARLDIPYHSIESLVWSPGSQTAGCDVTVTLREAPRCSKPLIILDSTDAGRKRVPGLDEEHENISGSCLVYRIILAHEQNITQRINYLSQIHRLPSITRRSIRIVEGVRGGELYSFRRDFKRLTDSLSPRTANLPFTARYQLQKLAQNGYLPIDRVLKLLPHVQKIFSRSGERITVAIIRKLFRHIPYASPDTDVAIFDVSKLVDTMLDFEEKIIKTGLYEEEVMEESEKVAIIHKAQVTPSGVYLCGPEAENNNRVLRKYSGHHEYFMRIQFSEEDGDRLSFSRSTSNKPIFARFQRILDEGISIAGRQFSFLGFSHSSLRSQSCWFMAPFVFEGGLLYYGGLVSGLGDFKNIRIPARCAARIGQAFSDTRDAITLPLDIKGEVVDVERNGRVFSDGCGTISKEALDLIWAGLPDGKKPTVLQIRYQGAKGMLSLDSRLIGAVMLLRPSMTKFRGSNSADLEICTAGYRPITLYLNEQLIPILEKLGVADEWFLGLQRTEIERLYSTTLNTKNASKFLSSHSIGDRIRLPWFLERLPHINLSFQQDNFLTEVVETTVLIQLRTLKYKARIPVRKGFTLLGIMDETGILREGEVFCVADVDGKSKIITGENDRRIIISRSPALHPGDIQMANAVTVPSWSPLMQLRNCICFSQKGHRDLPSMLSGGDLDGDLYHIIFDPDARPTRSMYQPAEYPRLRPRELDRPVEREDMTKFFIEFMETDQLGRICNAHKMLADDSSEGVADPRCIKLAEMASTAVDFSKTGIPVRMKEMPRYSRIRPHFMTPGPHVGILKDKPISFVSEDSYSDIKPDEDDDFMPFRYYQSHRILGQLFDAVDEHEIFKQLQDNRIMNTNYSTRNWNRKTSLLHTLWIYAQRNSRKTDWKKHLDRARGIRDEYEDSLLDLMFEYGPSPHLPLSEIEVFIGNILGKTGAPTHRQREMSMSMKERFEDILSATVKWITFQDEYTLQDERSETPEGYDEKKMESSVGVSMACLWCVLYDETRTFNGGKKGSLDLRSFGYVAAALCLKMLDRLGRF